MSDPDPATHVERLWASVTWWALAVLLVASVWLVLVVSTPPSVTAIGTFAAAGVVVGGLVVAGAVPVGVRGGEVVAGRAHVPLTMCGAITPLGPAATRELRGAGADARAFLVLRPWISSGVRVELTDPGDPTPYWLISARHPGRVAAAAQAARSAPAGDAHRAR